jgi:CheY-like chemotaxis protein
MDHAASLAPGTLERLTPTASGDQGGTGPRSVALPAEVTAALGHQDKLDLMGRVTGGVVHDFNNLLTVISGYCQLLLLDREQKACSRDMIRDISNAAEQAASLTRYLPSFCCQQQVDAKLLDLNALVTDMRKLLGRLIGEDVELILKLQPDLPRIKADPANIERIVLNLAVNARDAMPRGGSITIDTTVTHVAQASLERRAIPPGDYVVLALRDTGCGMNEETLARLFEPLFTTKAPGKGTGLGLATVATSLRQSGGHIIVDSAPSSGTSFKVLLPAFTDPAEKGTAPLASAAHYPGKETVLVVEDEESVRNLCATVLRSIGYHVLVAASAEEGLAIADREDGSTDLLITDVVLPKLSGSDIAQRLRRRQPHLKVLFISGYPQNMLARHGVQDLSPAFLRKPFAPQVLAKKVRSLLDQPPN